jgi:Flp pilus assembly protein TadD
MTTPLENYRLAEQYLDSGDPRSAVRLLEPLVPDADVNSAAAGTDTALAAGTDTALAAGTGRENTATVAVRLLLARAYFHTAQLRRAEGQFRKVLDLDPTDHFAHFALGRTLERQTRPEEALRHYRIAAAMTPSVEYDAAVTRLSTTVGGPA